MNANVNVQGATALKLSKADVLTSVAATVRAQPLKNLGGIERIEEYHAKEVAELPIAGTVFEVIAHELNALGIPTDETVGGVMAGLGFQPGTRESADAAHEIGCYCHGEFISPSMAADRILNLIRN